MTTERVAKIVQWLGYGLMTGVQFQKGLFLLPLHSDQLWVPLSLLSNEYWGLLPHWWSGQSMKLTTDHLVPTLRIHGAVPPIYVFIVWCLIKQGMSSWHGT